MELVLQQTQQGTSYEVSVSAEGVEELKRKVKIKGEKKEALFTLRQKPERLDTSAGNPVQEILLKLNLPDHRMLKIGGKGIKVQSDLKEFHEGMREIHYSLNNNVKLLCSMVEPLAKATVQRRKK
ncbi:hypothetical protein Tco_1569476 [Tanacetum coccineum]